MTADFFSQWRAECEVMDRAGMQCRTALEHARHLMAHRWIISDHMRGVVAGAARIIRDDRDAPSRWTHSNADRPDQTARFTCSTCGSVSKCAPYRCVKGCTDIRAQYGHDPIAMEEERG